MPTATTAEKLMERWRHTREEFSCSHQGNSTEVTADVIFLKEMCSSTGPKEYTTEEIFKLLTPWVSLANLTINTYRMHLPVRIMIVNPTTKEMLIDMYQEQGVLLADDARLYLPGTNGIEGALTVWWLPS